MFTSSLKRHECHVIVVRMSRMSRCSRASTTKKSTKSVLHVRSCCFADQPIAFLTFSLASPSSYLNVPFPGKLDGNNIRAVLITLELFLFCRKIGKKILMRKKPQNQNPKKKVRTRLKQEMIKMVMITMRMMLNLRRKVKCINSCECRHTTHCNYVLQNKIVVILVLMLALFCLLCSFFTQREKEIRYHSAFPRYFTANELCSIFLSIT